MSSSPRNKARTNTIIGTIAATGIAAVVGLGMIVPSGATFTDTDTARIDVTTATLSLGVNDADDSGIIDLDFTNLKPGETNSQSFSVTNNGTIPGNATVGSNFTNATPGANVNYAQLSVGVREDAAVLSPIGPKAVAGAAVLTPVTQLPASWNIGEVKPGQTRTFYVDVKLDSAAGNEWQGQHFGGNIPITLTQK